jgi:hypothetical protein
MASGAGGNWNWLWPAAAVAVAIVAGALAILHGTQVPGRSYRGPFEPLTEHERIIREEVKAHVAMLAETIGERNLFRYPALNAAGDYIREAFRAAGYAAQEQAFSVAGRDVKNIEAELRGNLQPEEIVVVGAHYDSVAGSPGANDNASGVAAMLALARLARPQRFSRTLRFVAFVNEEPPFFQTWNMGSRHYARGCAGRGERVTAMLSLETIGYYSEARDSQVYPLPFNLLYPDRGNFVAFVGNRASRKLLHTVVATFREQTRFPSEGAAAPQIIPGIGWSDHWSFWKEGYPAVMVTDTALYRYPQYHTPRDTPEVIAYDHLGRVVAGLSRVIEELAHREVR